VYFQLGSDHYWNGSAFGDQDAVIGTLRIFPFVIFFLVLGIRAGYEVRWRRRVRIVITDQEAFVDENGSWPSRRTILIVAAALIVICGSYLIGLRYGIFAEYVALFASVIAASAYVLIRDRIAARGKSRDSHRIT
jgi:hypothetical protein